MARSRLVAASLSWPRSVASSTWLSTGRVLLDGTTRPTTFSPSSRLLFKQETCTTASSLGPRAVPAFLAPRGLLAMSIARRRLPPVAAAVTVTPQRAPRRAAGPNAPRPEWLAPAARPCYNPPGARAGGARGCAKGFPPPFEGAHGAGPRWGVAEFARAPGAHVLGRTDETPQGPARRAGRPASGPRRGQVRRRDAAALPAVIVFLALGVSLLTIVLAQAVLGLDWFGSSSPPERPALLASPTARPAAGPAAPRLPLEPQGAETLGATPPGAKPFVNDPALAALVQQHLGGLRGLFGVAIKDLDSGRGVLINADREFPAASLFKLPVMYEVYRQRDAGRLSLADSLTLTAHYAQYDLGTLDVPVGSTVSVGWALERMITRSDNSTANLLLDRVGVANVNDTTRELGLRETRISGDKLTTSPRDMLLLLELLATGRGPSPNSSTEMVQLLLEQRVNDRLPAQLPRDTPVAHKTA